MGIEHDQFVELYQDLYPRVLAFTLNRVLPDEARETVDEAFLVAWRKRGDITLDGLLPWLFVTVRNIIANNRRQNRSRDVVTEEVAHLASDIVASPAEVDAVERLAVLSALGELTEREREALVLTAWDGLDNHEAAYVAGSSATAFAVRLHRARRRFAHSLAQMDRKKSEPERTTSRRRAWASRERGSR